MMEGLGTALHMLVQKEPKICSAEHLALKLGQSEEHPIVTSQKMEHLDGGALLGVCVLLPCSQEVMKSWEKEVIEKWEKEVIDRKGGRAAILSTSTHWLSIHRVSDINILYTRPL